MRILVIANHWAVSSARYATAAFERLGHEVRHVGPAHGRRIWGLDLPPGSEWKVNPPPDMQWEDMTIVMDTDPAMLEFGHNGNSPRVVWTVDNHVRDVRRPWFDHYFCAHRNVSVMAWPDFFLGENGVAMAVAVPEDMTHVPCCYDPTMHTPSPIAYEDRAYDVAMIGVMYPQRWALVKELRAAGLKVLAGTGLVGTSYRDAYHNARISLCMSSNGDVAQRVFETAAMGCLVISDDCPDFKLLNTWGIQTFSQGSNVVNLVKSYLADPDNAHRMIENARKWVKPHTWDARAQVIVDWYQKEHGVERTATALR